MTKLVPTARARERKRVLPKVFTSHPGVEEACFSGDSDYRYEVFLREGWAYRYGRMAGCRTGFFHTVADFLDVKPEELK